ncbi:MAG: hypothetical protein KGI80_00260 [Verrucomicrobiota bacterium]|nr:hypothetical protein [Verrucomicrobiota bacterium]
MTFITIFVAPYCSNTKPFDVQPEYNIQVIGCVHGGTRYAYYCLLSAGLSVGLGCIESDGYVGWPFATGFYNEQGEEMEGAKFHHTFHQVRHPLSVIASVLALMNELPASPSLSFIYQQVPEINQNDDPLIKSAKYWYYWNKKIESFSEWTYKVENLTDSDVIDEFEARLNLHCDRISMCGIPKHLGSSGKALTITWEMLQQNIPLDLFNKIGIMARRYGYDVPGY